MYDMLGRLRNVKHLTQVDPANEERNDEKLVRLVAESGTDGIIFAGTDDVNAKNLEETLEKFNEVDLVKIVAPSSPEMVPVELCKKILFSSQPLADWICPYVPYNAKDAKYITQLQKAWFGEWLSKGESILLDRIRELPYLIVSHHGTVVKKVPVDEDFSVKNIASYAAVAMMRGSLCAYAGDRRMCSPPWLYLETTGYDKSLTGVEPVEYVKACREVANKLGFRVYMISGGEIRNAEEARKRIEEGADAVNVGNRLYEEDRAEGYKAYLSTIRGAKPYISLRQHEKLLASLDL